MRPIPPTNRSGSAPPTRGRRKIATLRRMRFGRKSDKLDHQIERWELQADDLLADEVEAARDMPAADQAPGMPPARRRLPGQLPVAGRFIRRRAI